MICYIYMWDNAKKMDVSDFKGASWSKILQEFYTSFMHSFSFANFTS